MECTLKVRLAELRAELELVAADRNRYAKIRELYNVDFALPLARLAAREEALLAAIARIGNWERATA